MPRYWIIAPYANDELYDAVWNFDLANKCISIGWLVVDDVSDLNREVLQQRVAASYPDRSPQSHAQIAKMIWMFSHEVSVGDVVLARRGLRILAGVGEVTATASYTPGRNPKIDHPRFIGISWKPEPRDKHFAENKFTPPTIIESDEADIAALCNAPRTGAEPSDGLQFALEEHLQEFIARNWNSIFPELKFYEDNGAIGGEQFETGDAGAIDILAVEKETRDFVVIELKRDRTSDQVVGQVLRYMGWVKKNLCIGADASRGVRGMIICRRQDRKLTYAHSMMQNVSLKYYDLSFKLREQ